MRRRSTRTAGSSPTPSSDAGEMLAADLLAWPAVATGLTANWSVLCRRIGCGARRRPGRGNARCRGSRGGGSASSRARCRRPELAGVLVDVCCHDVGLEAAGRASGWPQRAAKVVLDLALTRLARHYGLIAPERPAASRMRHWGDADYRPSIDAWP